MHTGKYPCDQDKKSKQNGKYNKHSSDSRIFDPSFDLMTGCWNNTKYKHCRRGWIRGFKLTIDKYWSVIDHKKFKNQKSKNNKNVKRAKKQNIVIHQKKAFSFNELNKSDKCKENADHNRYKPKNICDRIQVKINAGHIMKTTIQRCKADVSITGTN